MAGKVKDQMIDGAMALLAQRGLQATSFAEVLAATGAPRGSLYHHFPGGKHELVAAAVDRAGALLVGAMASVEGQPAEAVVQRFLAIWRAVLTRSGFGAGCAVLAVTVAAGPAESSEAEDLLSHATAVFRAWRERLAALLEAGGLAAADARRFALSLIASVEGAVVLCRAERTFEAFEAVAEQAIAQVRSMTSRDAGR